MIDFCPYFEAIDADGGASSSTTDDEATTDVPCWPVVQRARCEKLGGRACLESSHWVPISSNLPPRRKIEQR